MKSLEKFKDKLKTARKQHTFWSFVWHSGIIVFGFLLSPVTWWNDLVFNIPIAWAMAWVPLKLLSNYVDISRTTFFIVMIFNYWITNVVGLMIMRRSGAKLIDRDAKLNYKWDIIIACAYTGVIAIFFYLDVGGLLEWAQVIPSWTT